MRWDWRLDPSRCWVGLDVDPARARLTLCLLPMLPLTIRWRPEIERYSGPFRIDRAHIRRLV